MLAVLLVSGRWGLWLGLFTAALSAAAFNFFHIPPTAQFTIANGENWVGLAVFLVAAGVTSTLANVAGARAADAEHRRAEADLTAEMARVLLSGQSLEHSLHSVGQRIAEAFELRSVAVEPSWIGSDQHSRALALVVDGNRVGTVLIPADIDAAVLRALEERVVPALAGRSRRPPRASREGAVWREIVRARALQRCRRRLPGPPWQLGSRRSAPEAGFAC